MARVGRWMVGCALLWGCEAGGGRDLTDAQTDGSDGATMPAHDGSVGLGANADLGTDPGADAAVPDGAVPEIEGCADVATLAAAGELLPDLQYASTDGTFRFVLLGAGDGQDEAEECADLERELAALVEGGAPGATVAFRSPTMELALSLGVSDSAGQVPMTPDTLFRIASTSKSYVGTLAALLALDGVVDLDDSDGQHALLDYLPELAGKIENADRITLRQLLDHTSGVPDYFGDVYGPAWLGRVLEAHRDGTRLTEEDALGVIYGAPADFAPGTSGAYSNTGYILAGRIMSAALGHPYQRALHERLLAPLGVHDTYAEKYDAIDPARLAHGYRDASPLGESFSDWFDVDQGYGFANGGLVTTAGDAARFFSAAVAGLGTVDGVPTAELAPLLRPATDGYSMGVTASNGCYGHDGAFSGYATRAFACPDSGRSWTLLMNSSLPEDDARLTAWAEDLIATRGVLRNR